MDRLARQQKKLYKKFRDLQDVAEEIMADIDELYAEEKQHIRTGAQNIKSARSTRKHIVSTDPLEEWKDTVNEVWRHPELQELQGDAYLSGKPVLLPEKIMQNVPVSQDMHKIHIIHIDGVKYIQVDDQFLTPNELASAVAYFLESGDNLLR